jgi:hypothetical protein
MIPVDTCEVCANPNLLQVLDLGLHPLCDDLISVGEERISKEFSVEIMLCERCCTAFQKFQVPREILFTKDYHYRARMTGSVLEGMKDLVSEAEKLYGSLTNLKVLDIGSNDGSLLEFFQSKGARVLGVEPTGAYVDSKVPVINRFFDSDSLELILSTFGKPDLIIFTNVFAHIENLPKLISNLKSIMHVKSRIIIENHYLGSVLKYGQFDTFYHEHPRTYSAKSFQYIANALGLMIEQLEFVSRYGGNIRVFMGPNNENQTKVDLPDESWFTKGFESLRDFVSKWKYEKKQEIEKLNQTYGPISAKAFPGRAAILIKLLDLDARNIDGVFEISGSIKVGHYVPGTRIPIRPEVELFQKMDSIQLILNLAWHIPTEVRSNLSAHGYKGKVMDIIEFKEVQT